MLSESKYNQAAFLALYVLGKQVLSQKLYVIVLSGQTSLNFVVEPWRPQGMSSPPETERHYISASKTDLD
jgi:hypothetical protein